MADRRLIETDDFAFEFLSRLAQRESWRKEVHRPVYHVHKWWAKRLGTVFRGILLGCALDETADLPVCFYARHSFSDLAVFDPFMGSGTTIGEAHKLGFRSLGRDINPVAVESVRVALGPMDRRKIKDAFAQLSDGVGETIHALYRSKDSRDRPCDVLYYFWVMQAGCPHCHRDVDLFSSYIIARNACPDRNANVQSTLSPEMLAPIETPTFSFFALRAGTFSRGSLASGASPVRRVGSASIPNGGR